MPAENDREFVSALLERNRYLVLSTTNGVDPWIAPLEYMLDGDLNFYFFSTEDSRHVRDIEMNPSVAVAVFDGEQPAYGADVSTFLNGVQLRGTVRKVMPADYSDAIIAAIDALQPPMPPYSVFRIEPERFYVPRLDNGVNVRTEVSME